MDFIHYTWTVFQYHGTLWWDSLKGRLRFCMSRKRSLARTLSNVKSWGWLPRGLETLILRKNANLCREGSSYFCPGFGCQDSKLRDGWGECRICIFFSAILLFLFCPSPPFWNMTSLIWFSLHLQKVCWNLTFTVSFSFLGCYEFIPFLILLRSLGRRKPGSYEYFILSLVIKLLKFIMKKSSNSQEK